MMGKLDGGKLQALDIARKEPGMHNDGRGLYLLVQESGSRSWILRTTIRGKRRDVGVGGFPAVPLAKAREKARTLRGRAKDGEDIIEARRIEKRVIPTFKEVAITYHKTISETFDSELHSRNWLRSLEQYVFPVFGNKAVDGIDSADVLKAIGPVWTTIPDTARRTLRRIKSIFDFCQGAGYRNITAAGVTITKPNPCDTIRQALPNNRGSETHHEALPYGELPTFIESLRKANSTLSVKLAFEFLILTASRTSEVLNATWDEIDLKAKLWTIPAERMKMKTAHTVPLSPRSIEILELAKQFNDGSIVFPSKPNTPLSNMSFLMMLRRMGIEITAHGFRATFKTWAEEKTTFDSLVIEASMAHAVQGIERHYLRTTFPEKRRSLMEAWASFATALKVVRMRA